MIELASDERQMFDGLSEDEIVGAVGVSGDSSDNDETAGVAGIEAAGLSAAV